MHCANEFCTCDVDLRDRQPGTDWSTATPDTVTPDTVTSPGAVPEF